MKFPHPLVVQLPSDFPTDGKTGGSYFHVLTYGKAHSEKYPYTVPNEKISSELGRAIGLPLPEILLYRLGDELMMFSRFVSSGDSGQVGPPGISQDVAKFFNNSPGLLERMVCLDIFICNNDRKPDNLMADEEGRAWLIDQGAALFYRPRLSANIRAGIPRLIAVENNLDELFDKPHAYLEHCKTWQAIDECCERIANIPRYFIEATVEAMPDDAMSREEKDFLIEFLNRRKTQIAQLFPRYPHLFPLLPSHS